jgi:hypothetical protein
VHALTKFSRSIRKVVLVALAVGALSLFVPGPVLAQDDPNTGLITFTGGLDVPTVYFFRGLRQEFDPKLTLWPYGDIGIGLHAGDGSVKTAAVNFGVWNSLQTGSSGSDGPSGKLHYEEDFYTTLNLGFGGGVGLGVTYMALTSPNSLFNTVKEFQLKVSKTGMFAPYVLLAAELTDDGQADAGSNKGTYLELGVGPSFPLMADGPTLAIPVKLGFSLKDYYESPLTGEDEKFGFLDIGGLITIPLNVPPPLGSWNFHAGANFLILGNTTEAFNVKEDLETKGWNATGIFGIGVSY